MAVLILGRPEYVTYLRFNVKYAALFKECKALWYEGIKSKRVHFTLQINYKFYVI